MNDLQKEFSELYGFDPNYYGPGTMPTRYHPAYVRWLEELVRKSRTRPDLNPCPEESPNAEV